MAEAEQKWGIKRPAFSRAIKILTEFGFITIPHHGGGTEGDANQYAISERYKAYGTENFKVIKPRPKDTRTDRGWAAYHKKKNNEHPKIIILKRRRIRLPKKKLSIVNVTGAVS